MMEERIELKPICEGYKKGTDSYCLNNVEGSKDELCSLDTMFRCVEYIRLYEPTLSYSSIKNLYCWRKFYWSYIVGIQRIEKPWPMMLGSLADQYLNIIHGNLKPTINISSYKNDSDEYPANIEALRNLFKAYKEKFGEMKGQSQVSNVWWEPGYPKLKCIIDLITNLKTEEGNKTIGYEFKYTSRPEIFGSRLTVEDQFSAEFLTNPQLQRITLRAIQVPQLRQGKNESISDYGKRVYGDFMSRPFYYINDKSFWRSEFNLDEFKAKLRMIASELKQKIEDSGGSAYSFRKVSGPATCFSDHTGKATSVCEFLEICTSGVVSEKLYTQREK